MPHWTSLAPTILASFMASLVEFVEALTIVLAVGIVRGWRSALLGSGAALLVLLALVALLGPSLARIPLPNVQLVLGTLLLLFGLRWLRKAVLRAAGVLAMHDETKAFEKESALLRGAGRAPAGAVDRIAFATSFKIVILEGIEVVFIVIAIGAGGPLIVPASIGAGLALVVVSGLGLVLHRPLARVPENTLKFGVGVLLSAFGTFWLGEGIGLAWPGGDWAMLGLIGVYLGVGAALVPWCAGLHRRRESRRAATPVDKLLSSRGVAATIARQAWSLFVDDSWLAAGAVLLAAATWAARAAAIVDDRWATIVLAAGLGVVLALSARRRALAPG